MFFLRKKIKFYYFIFFISLFITFFYNLKFFEEGLFMYEIIFKFKYILNNGFFMGNMFFNLQFYLPHIKNKDFYGVNHISDWDTID